MTKTMIYIVEDEQSIRELLIYALQNSGYMARGFGDGRELFAALHTEKASAILLDIMLPEEDGLSILKKIRSTPGIKDIPVLLVTAKSSEIDKIVGLDSGADDYITKPFSMMELSARIKAILRRVNRAEEPAFEKLHIGEILIDPAEHTAYVSGKPVNLTLKEYELLYFLMQNSGLVFSRDKLLQKIWGYDFDGETRTVDVHIRSLRQKLAASATHLQTIRGIGYRFNNDIE